MTMNVGKPHTHERAVEQLRTASGKKLSAQVIESYLRKKQPYNCAGSVRSEGLGIALLERFEGDDLNTLIGLPLIRLVAMLENKGFFYSRS